MTVRDSDVCTWTADIGVGESHSRIVSAPPTFGEHAKWRRKARGPFGGTARLNLASPIAWRPLLAGAIFTTTIET